jgi:hypothetical protein
MYKFRFSLMISHDNDFVKSILKQSNRPKRIRFNRLVPGEEPQAHTTASIESTRGSYEGRESHPRCSPEVQHHWVSAPTTTLVILQTYDSLRDNRLGDYLR